jgi:hypothetical protein
MKVAHGSDGKHIDTLAVHGLNMLIADQAYSLEVYGQQLV